MLESELQQRIQIDGPAHRCILLRNNSGVAVNPSGQPIRFGLGNISKQHGDRIKSSDLIGITQVVVTPQMVGQVIAVFTAVECKAPEWKPSVTDRREVAQRAFIDWVKSLGGFAGFANSIESFRKILGK